MWHHLVSTEWKCVILLPCRACRVISCLAQRLVKQNWVFSLWNMLIAENNLSQLHKGCIFLKSTSNRASSQIIFIYPNFPWSHIQNDQSTLILSTYSNLSLKSASKIPHFFTFFSDISKPMISTAWTIISDVTYLIYLLVLLRIWFFSWKISLLHNYSFLFFLMGI